MHGFGIRKRSILSADMKAGNVADSRPGGESQPSQGSGDVWFWHQKVKALGNLNRFLNPSFLQDISLGEGPGPLGIPQTILKLGRLTLPKLVLWW